MKTDAQLQQDVLAELKWEPAVQAARIGVEVRSGVVTLAGQVDSFAEKWGAERAAQRVSGVKATASELTVQLQGLHQRGDTQIADAVQNVLSWTSCLPAGAVKVLVQAGWVTLSGELAWQYQRLAAAENVRHLMGVTGLSNQIVLKAAPVAGGVQAEIEAALLRSTIVDAQGVNVGVHDGEVTLSGTVGNWWERETATHAAWGTPGVRNVVDRLVQRA